MIALPNLVVSLYDKTGNMVRPWLDAGRICLIVDIQHPPGLTTEDGRLWRLGCDLRGGFDLPAGLPAFRRVEFVACFPPCDHLAVSGARWFKGKGLRLLSLSVDMFATAAEFCERMVEKYGARYMIENPVSTISTYWREPDHRVHPFQFTGIESADNYLKNTCLWVGGGFELPPEQIDFMVDLAVAIVVTKYRRLLSKKTVLDRMARHKDLEFLRQWYPDDRIHDASPGDDRADKRSETPMGFAHATFLANAVPEPVDLFA